jgi:hypothetical protein
VSTSPPSEPLNPDPRSYPSETIHVETAAPDLLVSPAEEAAERPGRRSLPTVVAIATVVALLLGGAAFAGMRLWYGSGMQPEEAIPSTVVAFARLDLSPGYGQRLAVNDLLKKFPREGGKDTVDELKKDTFGSLDIDEAAYRKHVEPWFAERIGAGLWLDGKNQPYGLIALAVKDEAAARSGLAELQRNNGAEKFGFVVRKGYVLVASGGKGSQAAAEAAGRDADQRTLAADAQFRRGLERLPARQTALGWIDLAKYGAAMKALTSAALDGMPDGLAEDPMAGAIGPLGGIFPGISGLTRADALTGQLILGARATDDGVEVHFRGFGTAPAQVGPADARSTVNALPANSAIAGSLRVGDVGEALAGTMPGAAGPLPEEVLEGLPPGEVKLMRKQMQEERDRMQAMTQGFSAVSGAKLSVAVTKVGKDDDVPSFAASAETTSVDKAAALAGALKLVGDEVTVSASGNRVEARAKGYAAEGGSLDGQALYRQALEGAPEQANTVIYVDVQRLLAGADMTEKERGQAKAVKAVGLATAIDGRDEVGLLRVIIK